MSTLPHPYPARPSEPPLPDSGARQVEPWRERDRHGRALLRLSKRLERADTREEVCRAADGAVREATGYSVIWIYLFNEDGEHADVYFANGPAAEPIASRLQIRGDRMMEEIFAATSAVVVEDARTDPRTDKAIVAELGNRTIINVPVLLPGKRLGALGTGTFGDEGVQVPTPAILAFLSALASHVAVALDRVASILERQKAEARLAESEERYRQVFENSRESLFLAEVLDDGRFRLIESNPAFERSMGLPRAVSLGKLVDENMPPAAAEVINGEYRHLVATGTMTTHEVELDLPAGRRTFESTLIPVRDPAGSIYRIVGIASDVTEKRAAEISLQRVLRTLLTLSVGNEALVRATTEPDLLARMCRVLVEQGGYRMAWIGLRASPTDELRSAAAAGEELGYLEVRAAKVPADREGDMTDVALASGKPQVVHDIAASSLSSVCREAALSRGYRSAAALPLRDGSTPFGTLTLFSADTNAYDEPEMSLLVKLADDVAYGIHALRARCDRERGIVRLQATMDATTQALASMVELRDPYTAGHQRRVAQLSAAIGRRVGLSEDRVHGLHLAGIVHDVGKIYVPAEILARPGRLTTAEFEMVKPHVLAGYEILRPIDFDWPIAELVRQHHERLDGSGYPRGLSGDQILPDARILTVADVVEAMTNFRPYRAALGVDAALAEIERGRGVVYDAEVVDACVVLFREEGFAFG